MELAHQSPRDFSKERSTWSLELLAEVAFEEVLTDRVVSHEAIRQAISEMGHFGDGPQLATGQGVDPES